ncbi:efflux RND transporter periplasmic adaptor subunit [Psychromonas sp. MME2]|uniref:efflux RND transporter periplasmic adaptor subunit n=1 Tax=unclassified Psychromonas TaxID=2614957 RepID=UPI00339BFED9
MIKIGRRLYVTYPLTSKHLLLLLGFFLVGCDKKTDAPPPVVREVKVITVEPKTVDIKIPRLAQLESSKEVAVVARVSGFLDKVAYKEGTALKKGDVMFIMDKRPFLSELDATKGELAAAQARLWTANANLKRIKPLAEADAMSQSDLDTATGEQRAAEAAVYSAQAAVKNAQLNLSYTTIKAPVTGLSGAAFQREGAYLNSMGESAYISYVAQLDPIWVNFALSQNELTKYMQEQKDGLITAPEQSDYKFEIVLADGSTYPHTGYLDFSSPIFDKNTGTVKIRAVVPNPNLYLRPGMFVSANILGAKRPNSIVIPQQAVQQRANGPIVLVVNDKGIVEAQPVVIGEWLGDGWIIEDGLNGGEALIVDGFKTTAPGMKVKALHYIPKAKESAKPENTKDQVKTTESVEH